jgi:hypothetical protein
VIVTAFILFMTDNIAHREIGRRLGHHDAP